MSGVLPEEHIARPVAFQRWREVTFVHWAYEPEVVERFVPAPLVADTFADRAWVGLTLFAVEGARAASVLPVPTMVDYLETNLRTYVRAPDGRDVVLFLALDVGSPTVAAVGRLTSLPHYWSEMAVNADEGPRYHGRRRVGGTAEYDVRVAPAAPVDDDELATFLTGRWRALTAISGRIVSFNVEHQPWPLQHASILSCSETVRAAAGLPISTLEPIGHYAAGVDVRIGVTL